MALLSNRYVIDNETVEALRKEGRTPDRPWSQPERGGYRTEPDSTLSDFGQWAFKQLPEGVRLNISRALGVKDKEVM